MSCRRHTLHLPVSLHALGLASLSSSLAACSGLVGWDEMTMMPEGAAESRAKMKSALAGVIHEKSCDAALGEVLAKLQAANLDQLNQFEQVGWCARA